ncbi:MAG: phosphotransferase [Chloroflexi bacterium]|nr:phosphotransferase [Chloroflexota bacterium]
MTFAAHWHFDDQTATLLGRGSESAVYALDGQHVLRHYHPGISDAYVAARAVLCERIAAAGATFTVPQVVAHGQIAGRPATIERRLAGADLATAWPALTPAARHTALTSYQRVAGQIGRVCFPAAPYGELLDTAAAIRRDRWPEYLMARLDATLARSRGWLLRDVPRLAALLRWFERAAADALGSVPRALVHGDYFPGNVFVDDRAQVYAVGDWGYSTIVGDPRLDQVTAAQFLALVDGMGDDARTTALARLAIDPLVIALYTSYAALYFAPCHDDDPRTYAWCVATLRQISATC